MPDFSMVDWYGDESIAGGFLSMAIILLPGLSVDVPTFRIGRHRFTFYGPECQATGWRKHLERCARDYEVRQAIRQEGRFL